MGNTTVEELGFDPASADFSELKLSGDETISVDFPDEEIRTIVRNIGDIYELNIFMPDTLQERTSIKLRDVTWRQLFDAMLPPHGYTYREVGNIIYIDEVGLTAGDYIEIGVIVVLIFSLLLNAILAPCVFVLVWNRKKA